MLNYIWRVKPTSLPTVLRNCPKCGVRSEYECSRNFRVNANRNRIDVWLIYQCKKCKATWNMEILSRTDVRAIDKELYQRFLQNDRELAAHYAFDVNLHQRNRAAMEYSNLEYDIHGDNICLHKSTESSLHKSMDASLHKNMESSLPNRTEASLPNRMEASPPNRMEATPHNRTEASLPNRMEASPHSVREAVQIEIICAYPIDLRLDKLLSQKLMVPRETVKRMLEQRIINVESCINWRKEKVKNGMVINIRP